MEKRGHMGDFYRNLLRRWGWGEGGWAGERGCALCSWGRSEGGWLGARVSDLEGFEAQQVRYQQPNAERRTLLSAALA